MNPGGRIVFACTSGEADYFNHHGNRRFWPVKVIDAALKKVWRPHSPATESRQQRRIRERAELKATMRRARGAR
jgi:hypothetical protein